MARIIYREDFNGQKELFKSVLAKHIADGLSSPLTSFLADKNIDLALLDTNNVDPAADAETNRRETSRKGEDFRQKRDLNLNKPFANVRPMLQYLKTYYAPNTAALGNWGADVNGNSIVIPTEIADKIQLFKDIKTRHDALMPNSPLQQFLINHSINLVTDLAKVIDSGTWHRQMEQAKKDAEDFREDRNNLMEAPWKAIRKIGDFLKKLYYTNSQQLGYWGYTIDESKKKPKFRLSKVKAAGNKTVNGVVLGSTFTNLGQTELKIYKGKKAAGSFVALPPGEMYGMTKGCSVITVVNISSTQRGIFKTLAHH